MQKTPSGLAFIFCLAVILGAGFLFLTSEKDGHSKGEKVVWNFELVDPQMAPEEIKPLVMQGYNFILETKKYLPEFAGDRINCTNCHFAGGNTVGGVNGGISLVGVTKKYPRKLDNGKELTLAQRINACFQKSLNGNPLPVDSQPMLAMITYLQWISSPVEKMETTPWLGLKSIRSSHVPDPVKGDELYHIYCYECHGKDGQGQLRREELSYPPLWGPDAFNTDAGMNELSIFSSFIYQNMPYTDPGLTEEEALDIASFVIKQPRPTRE